MGSWRPIESVDFKKAKYLEDRKMLNEELALGALGALIFAPFLVVLPLIIKRVYHRDFKNFEDPYKMIWHKEKFWMWLLVPMLFFLFWFGIFPLIPSNVPIWGNFWGMLVLTRNMLINGVLLAVSEGLTGYFMLKIAKPKLELLYHPYRKYVGRDDYLIIPTRDKGPLFMDKINTGIMVLGAPGSGKTETIKQIVYQLQLAGHQNISEFEDYAWIIFDPKGDYCEEFGDPETDVILSVSPHESTYAWNIFREIAPRDPLQNKDSIYDEVDSLLGGEQSDLAETLVNSEDILKDILPTPNGAKATSEEAKQVIDSLGAQAELEQELKDSEIGLSNASTGATVEKSLERMEEDPKIAIAQIMGELFKELTESSQDKFWNYAAQQVLEGIIYIMYQEAVKLYEDEYREWEEMYEDWELQGKEGEPPEKPDFYNYLPTNAALYEKVTSSSFKDVYNEFMQHPELKMVAMYINPKAEKMAGSVWAVLGTQFKRVFQGAFGPQSDGLKQISMKEYMRNPDGRKLFIEYHVEKGEVLGAVYRVLIDRLIAFGFERGSEDRKKYFLIDEFQNVPKLSLYQNLVNFGRSYNMTSVIGIQALSQVVSTYGKDLTNSAIAGHRFVIAFALNDEDSMKYVKGRIGSEEVWHRRPVQISSQKPGGGSTTIGGEYQKLEYTPINLGKIMYWGPGEAVIMERSGFMKVQLMLYKEGKVIIKKIKKEINEIGRKIEAEERRKKARKAKKTKEPATARTKKSRFSVKINRH